MGDHFSGPRVFGDPAADITDLYAFPSPELPGHVVLVLNVFPGAAVTSLFSDAITYRFRIRPVTPASTGAAPAYTAGEDEHTFDFTFTVPSADGTQTGTCTAPGGEQISFQTGDGAPAQSSGLRIFAGAPEHAARLACALSAAGHRREAGQWRSTAAARYDELVLRHPEAFATYAADFRAAGRLAPASLAL